MFDGDNIETVRAQAFENRGKIAPAAKTLKNHLRNRARIKAHGEERIHIVVADERSNVIPGCSWYIARRKFQFEDVGMDFVYKLLAQAPVDISVVEYFQELDTGEVVFPSETFQRLTLPPATWTVVSRHSRISRDLGKDPHFEGDVYVFLTDVPMMTDNNVYPVTAADLEAYLRFGVAEQDDRVATSKAFIKEKERQIALWDKKIRGVPFEALVDPNNRLIEDILEQEKEREARYQTYVQAKNEQMAEKEAEEKALEQVQHRFDLEHMHFQLIEHDTEAQIGKYTMSVDGPQSAFILDLLMKKTDWQGIRMAVASHRSATWVGRANVPSGGRPNEPDLKAFEVNVRNLQLARMQHGFGTYLDTALRSDGENFIFYHGQWRHGERHGYGVEYSIGGIYSGPFERGRKQGLGRLDFANGDIATGNFACGDRLDRAADANPYNIGSLNGLTSVTFADGSFFEGRMENGLPSGEGRYYTSQGDSHSGTFERGRLHGQGRVELIQGIVLEGEFRHGKLHGPGRQENKYGDSYAGDWHGGQKAGAGVQEYRNGDVYHGFFANDTRTGRGACRFGNVHTATPEALDRPVVMSDQLHEGRWAADEVEPRGMVTTYPSENTYYTAQACRHTFPYLLQLQREDTIWKRRLEKRSHRIVERERLLRRELLRQKKAIFEAQVDEARASAIAYEQGRLSTKDLRQRYAAREERLDGFLKLQSLEGDELEAFWDRMLTDIGAAADAVDNIADMAGTESRRTLLVAVVQSAFEEMEERFKLLNVERIADKTRQKADDAVSRWGQAELTAAEASQKDLAARQKKRQHAAMLRGSGGVALRRHVGPVA